MMGWHVLVVGYAAMVVGTFFQMVGFSDTDLLPLARTMTWMKVAAIVVTLAAIAAVSTP